MRFLILNKKNERDERIDDLLMFPPLSLKEIEEKKDEIEKFLQDPNLLENIRKILDIRIVGEDSLKLLTFLCATSVFHRYKMSIILQGQAATGKSYICRNVLRFFPNVIHFSRMTPAFLDRFSLNLNNYIFYVYELLASQEATGQLRLVLSEGELRLAAAESVGGGKVETRIISTKGTPVYITTTINPVVEDQLGSRCWLASTDSSEEQTRKVVHHIAIRHSTPDWDVEKQEEVLLKYVMNYFSYFMISNVIYKTLFDDIMVPYAEELAKLFNMKEERMRRDYERLLNLIKTITLLYHKQRSIVELPVGRKMLLSNLDDLYNALKIAEPFMTMTFYGLHRRAIEIYKELKDVYGESEFTVREAAEVVGLSMNRTRELLKALYDKGFLFRDESRKIHNYSFSKKEMLENVTIIKTVSSPEFFPPEKLQKWLDGIGGKIAREQSNTSVIPYTEFGKNSSLVVVRSPENSKEAQIEPLKLEELQKSHGLADRGKSAKIEGAFYCERCGSYFMTIQDFSEHMKVCLGLKSVKLQHS
jgi:DNA-binding transcriptional ArsR family regulator